ncbi:hypothetical protein B0O99DRAFT_657113 [Bisporella sp. PMI_857]|nr:hypothetical protein B0O99DRAFT_657113 [Bisporella sp. PMI_857]
MADNPPLASLSPTHVHSPLCVVYATSLGYGIPSSHSQFVAFFSLSMTIFLLFRYPSKRPTPSRTPLSLVARVVAWSRTYSNYHTPKQLLIGCPTGSVTVRRAGQLAWILEQYPTRLFQVRDPVVAEDLCRAG